MGICNCRQWGFGVDAAHPGGHGYRYQRAGWMGLVLGGVCFILPASAMTLVIAWAYVRYGQLPQGQALLYGVKPVILAIVVQALWNLGKTAFRKRPLIILGLAPWSREPLGPPSTGGSPWSRDRCFCPGTGPGAHP